MYSLPNFWRSLEELPELNAVPLVWRQMLGPHFAAFQTLCLETLDWLPSSYPCPIDCGCWHEIVPSPSAPGLPPGYLEGPFRALCRCEPPECPDLTLTLADLTPLQANRAMLGRALCQALDLESKPADLGLPLSPQIGSWSPNAVPVILTIHYDTLAFRADVADLAVQLAQPFILLTPTTVHIDAHIQSLLARVHAALFTLESTVRLTEQGKLLPLKAPGELFAQFRPEPNESVAEETARQVWALARTLDAASAVRKAPPFRVFLFYCVDGLSAGQIARQCHCSRPVVFARLKWLRHKLGCSLESLRQYSGHFQKMEDSLTDPRARRIDRKTAAFGETDQAEN